ncbi:MAG: hypothetical protein ISS28_07305 [Candidatus Cloacimonetes bacterium]|nr:hypothetical protein [Candidatus Cloacimonadota bacterium]
MQLNENNLQRITIKVKNNDSLFICEQFSEYLENELTKQIIKKCANIKIVERKNLNDIMEEQKLQLSGLFDEETAISIGYLSGAQAIIPISYSITNGKIFITGKAINTETGEIIISFNEYISITPRIDEILQQGEYIFYADGFGQAPNSPDLTELIKKQMAKRAALADSYRNLIEKIKGNYLNSHTETENFTLVEDKITLIGSGYLKNAEVIDVKYLTDGSVKLKVLLVISKKEFENLLQ